MTGPGTVKVTRLAMWSGPRNISTALMRAWGNRTDTVVCDEPFYAHYLLETRVPHPGAAEVIAHHETDWRIVQRRLVGELPTGAPSGTTLYYQKHMAHHLLPHMVGDWLWELRHGLLIRDPREMLLSLSRVLAAPTLADTGLPQQVELLERLAQRGIEAVVVDARDVLENPRFMLTTLCARWEVPFEERMLHWPAGRRDSDGIWSKHWYHEVERSTGFRPYRPRSGRLPEALAPLLEACRPYYDRLYDLRLTE